jgi:hypothetical protein
MATRKTTTKSGLQKKLKPAPRLNMKKFEEVFRTITDARIALNALNLPQRIVPVGPTRQELDSLATKLGLDPKVLDQERTRKNAELLRLAKLQKEDAVKKSASVQKLLARQLPVLMGSNSIATQGGPTEYYLISTPYVIQATAGLTAYGYERLDGPGNSFAKFQLEKYSGAATETLTFFFLWYSPGLYTFISVEAFLIMNGYLRAVALGGIAFDLPDTFVTIAPTLGIYDESANPFTFSVRDLEWESGADAQPSNLGPYQYGVSVSTNVAKWAVMRAGPFGVPPNSTVVMEVSVDVIYSVEEDNGGSIDADFSSNAYNIAAPGVIVTKWS